MDNLLHPNIIRDGIHPLSLSTFPAKLVRVYDDGTTHDSTSLATCFLYYTLGRLVLVSNYHNYSGLNPRTGGRIGTFIPNYIIVTMPFYRNMTESSAEIHSLDLQYPLLNAAGEPNFFPKAAAKGIDISVLPIEIPTVRDADIPGFAGCDIGQARFDQNLKPKIGDDCFVVGFPKGLRADGNSPIWKRASIASEPKIIERGNTPRYLIDTATRKGMSGSPVIYRERFADIHLTADNDGTRTREDFLGVYSGRLDDDPFGIQIGIVWPSQFLLEIIGNIPRDIAPVRGEFLS